jgi:iron complex transport system permease protein
VTAVPPALRFSLGRLVAVLVAGSVLLVVALALGAAFGEQPLSFQAIRDGVAPDANIFFQLRLPRVILAAMVGAALAASGATLQSLTRNPLADPFVLGVSGGSALGATLALALGLSALPSLPGVSAVTVLSFVGGVGATALVMLLGRLAGGNAAHATLLAGVVFNAFALASITFIKALVAPDRLGEVLYWLAGALGHEEYSTLAGTGVLIGLALAVLWAQAGRLNLLMLGDDDAASLGVPVVAARRIILLAASLAVSAAVSLAGLVGFVGLLVPHGVRGAVGPDLRLLLPASALAGAAFLVLADLAARLLFGVFQAEPPVGVVTALLGGPVFLFLMAREARTTGGLG